MAVIADSSSLILYSAIDRLEILQAVFDEVLIPDAVWTEVVEQGGKRPGSSDLARFPWMRRQTPVHLERPPLLGKGLGPGETVALALALVNPPPIILDDLPARKVAQLHGLAVTGSAGVLLAAKRSRVIAEVRPLLAELRAAGLFLSDALVRQILHSAGESSP